MMFPRRYQILAFPVRDLYPLDHAIDDLVLKGNQFAFWLPLLRPEEPLASGVTPRR